ncbi:MAG: class I SAM-dependent methyltransferase [Nocardioides sp.]|uniref:class I SAM-dependent methyltransferase n=1 Tax=Nocardioides sp. TaxID=35761 RepID=UPI0039E6685E
MPKPSGRGEPVRPDLLEITDLLWPTDDAGVRGEVRRDEAIKALASRGQRRAAALVARMPHADGVVDEAYVRGLMLRIHRELSRLGEELQLARRVAALLSEPLERMRSSGRERLTVVDVGCGLGHVLRSAAAYGWFPRDVRLVGVDLNGALVEEARRLAAVEELDVRFVHGDAFDLALLDVDPSRSVVISSGLLHHLDVPELRRFFAAHEASGFAGFAHWDIAPCRWSTLGAWVFHQARMREAVSRHDGVMSARRAHPASVLLEAARTAAPRFRAEILEGSPWHPRALDVLRPVVGWR